MRTVLEVLDEFRAAVYRRAVGEALVWGALCAIACGVLAAAWLGYVAPSERVRQAGHLAISLALIGTVAWRVRRMRMRFREANDIAAWLESRVPALRTDVRTALEWNGRPATDDPDLAAMRSGVMARAERELRRIRSRVDTLVPRRDMRRPAIALLVASLAVLGATWATPDGFGAGARALVFGTPIVDEDGKVVAERPLVSTVDYEIHYPAYTRREPRQVFGSTGNIQALEGSEVVFQARTLVPVTDAVLRVERGDEVQRVQLEVVAGVRVRGRFPIVGDGVYRFELTLDADADGWAREYAATQDGGPAVDPVVRRIDALPDEAPTVELLAPGETVEVTPDHVVDIEYIARDDFGLSAVSLVWHFAGDEAGTRQMPLQGAVGAPLFQEHVPFDLAPLHLQARDEVIVYIEAVDNDQAGGAKAGRSRPIVLRVASPDDRHQEVLALEEQLFEQLLVQLGGTLSARMVGHAVERDRDDNPSLLLTPNTGTVAENADRIAAQRAVHGDWLEVMQVFDALVKLMDEDPLSIDADRAMLRGTYDRLYAAVLDEGRALERFTQEVLNAGVDPPRFGAAANRVADTLQTTERAILVLEDIIATHKADNVNRAMEELADVRDRLQELLEQYRDTQDPEVREQIERELRRLEQRMRELMAQLASQIEQLPTEHLNADAIEPSEVAESIGEMQSAMDQIRQMLDSGDIDSALDLLEQLEAELGAMDQELQPLGDAQPETLSEFDREMGALMDELNNVQAMEADVEAQTQALLDEMMAERAEEMQTETQRALEDAMRTLQEAHDRLVETGVERLGPEARATMQTTTETVERMQELLSEGDVAGTEQAATRMLSQLSDAQWELRREESMMLRDDAGREQARESQRALRQTDSATRDVRDAMRDLMEAAQPRPNPAQQAQMEQLSQQQGEVTQRMEQMQQRVEQMGQRFPMVQDELQPTLEEAQRHMEGAEGQLGGRRPRPALQSEQAAQQTLQQAREQMQQLTQRQRQREQRQSQGRRPEQEVEVPEDGESGRADFRRRVVESMRDDALEAYDEEIRRYYERLLE